MKVIHIVESLDRGAVENWLIRMYKYGIDNGHKLDWTFYCIESFEGRKEAYTKSLGAKVLHSEYAWSKPFELIKALRAELKMGHYDVVHSHHDFMSALYLISSYNLKIKKFVHIHNMDEHIPTNSKLKACILRPIFRRICWYKADKIIGVSKHTLKQFILGKSIDPKKHRLHYCGVNAELFFNSNYEPSKFREKLKLNSNSKLMLFSSRFAPAKNPLFAVEVLNEMVKKDKSVVGLFVGSGNLEENILKRLNDLNLDDNSRFIGWSDQIPYLMKNSDLFILPHVEYPMEGLGLVVLEAQLAEMPILISKGVSMDPILPNSLFKQLSLKDRSSLWADEALNLISLKNEHNFNIKNDFKSSHFNMENAFRNLIDLYES